MNATSIFKNLGEIIKIDHFNFQEIRYDFEKNPDYSSVNDEIVLSEICDSKTGDMVYLEEPQRISFESELKNILSAELNTIVYQIEEENSKKSSTDENILFLISCLAKADNLVTAAETVKSDYSNLVTEVLRTLSNQLHRRFDKELDFKLNRYESDSGKSHSDILLELQRMNELKLSEKTRIDQNIQLKFKLNRNQLTVLFLLLLHNDGLSEETKPADIVKFLNKYCLCLNEKTKEYGPVKDVTSLISDFLGNQKLTDAPIKYIKKLFHFATLKYRE